MSRYPLNPVIWVYDMDLHVISLTDIGAVRILQVTAEGGVPLHCVGHYAVLQFGTHAPRPYSIANLPNGHYLEFHIKNSGHVGGGSVEATTSLHVGDPVTFHRFGGNYTYLPDCPLPLVLIAGGTGLAPLLAMARASLSDQPARPVTLYHGGRHQADLYAHKALLDMATEHPSFRYIPVLSEDRIGGIAAGYVGDVALENLDHPARIYIAGPGDMLRATVQHALQKGVSADHIHSDLADIGR